MTKHLNCLRLQYKQSAYYKFQGITTSCDQLSNDAAIYSMGKCYTKSLTVLLGK